MSDVQQWIVFIVFGVALFAGALLTVLRGEKGKK